MLRRAGQQLLRQAAASVALRRSAALHASAAAPRSDGDAAGPRPAGADAAARAAAAAADGDGDDDGDDDDDDDDFDDREEEEADPVLARVAALSRKRQQSTLTDMLRDRSSLRDAEAEVDERQERAMDMHVVDVNRTVKVTKGGSLQRFSALVVVGNGDGVVGWASGKAPEVGAAVDKAYSRASRKLFYFERFEGHTLWHGATGRYGRSKVDLGPLPSGSGLRANQTVAAVCRLAGFKDVRAKVHGSHNPQTTLRAVFEALDAIRSPEEVAAARGRPVVAV